MSLTSTVPVEVPSLLHNSVPWMPLLAVENSVPLIFPRFLGKEPALPGWMFLTRIVPSAVPSLFHRSVPFVPSSAEKNRVPLTLAKLLGLELSGKPYELLPGRMSLTRTVPAAAPSLFHNSNPVKPSLAEKNSVPWTSVRLLGRELSVLVLMSLTNTVPAAVPSHFHSSVPCAPSSAAKNSVPLTSVRFLG